MAKVREQQLRDALIDVDYPADKQTLLAQLTAFNTMYRPHESREDTVLFPAFRKIVSKHEYD